MTALLTLFGVLSGACVLLIGVLVRRTGRRARTETHEGLRIEREALIQAGIDRVSYNARAVHNSLPTATDVFQRKEST